MKGMIKKQINLHKMTEKKTKLKKKENLICLLGRGLCMFDG